MHVKLRLAVGAAAIWVAAVAGVSVTAWLAIDRAGREVTNATVSALPPASIGTAASATTSDQGASSTGPTTKPHASKTLKPSTSNPATVAPPSSPANTRTGSVTPTPVRDRTVTVAGGQVSVRCIGSGLTLRIAQPDNGWRVELDRSDSADAQVTFKSGDGEASPETQVTATCSAGTPVFTVDSKGSPHT